MSIQKHKQAIMEGDGRVVMERFFDEMTLMVENNLWKAYKEGDTAEIGRGIAEYMGGLVFDIAKNMQDFEELENLMDQSQQECGA